MHIKDYSTHPKNKIEIQRIQNWRLLKIVRRNVNKTYNEYEKY